MARAGIWLSALTGSSSRRDEMFIERTLRKSPPRSSGAKWSCINCRKHCAPLERGSCITDFYKHLAPLDPVRCLVAAQASKDGCTSSREEQEKRSLSCAASSCLPLLPAAPLFYCHLKIFSAITKLTSSHASNIATWIQLAQSGTPSFITARRSVLSAVNGNALMNG